MRFSTELLVVIGAIVVFYLRIAQLRGQKRRLAREFALKRRKVNGRSKGMVMPSKAPGTPPYQVKSWILVGVSVLVMIFGLLLYNNMSLFGMDLVKSEEFLNTYTDFWYIPVVIGILLLAFSITIDKPTLEEE